MKPKAFDCVEMKRRIQEAHIKMFEGLSPEQESEMIQQKVAQNPLLGNLWRRARRVQLRGTTRSSQ